MLKKIASLAAMLSASLTVAGCQTAMYKPIICEPGTALKDGRCQKVSQTTKKAKPSNAAASQSTRTRAPVRQFVPLNPAAPPGARQNVYGLPPTD